MADESDQMLHSNLGGQLECSVRFRKGMSLLKEEGWNPDAVLSHSGWGCGLDVGWIFPLAKRLMSSGGSLTMQLIMTSIPCRMVELQQGNAL